MNLKRLCLILVLALTCFAQQSATYASLADISGSGSVVALSNTSIMARWVQLMAPTANSSNVVCCDAAITTSRGAQISAGQPWFLPPTGPAIDLSKVYVLVQSGDKLKVTYQVYP